MSAQQNYIIQYILEDAYVEKGFFSKKEIPEVFQKVKKRLETKINHQKSKFYQQSLKTQEEQIVDWVEEFCRDEYDRKLVAHNPQQLLIDYAYCLEKEFAIFFKKGYFDLSEKAETLQMVAARVLKKLKTDKIKALYIKSYFNLWVQRITNDEHDLKLYFNKALWIKLTENIKENDPKAQAPKYHYQSLSIIRKIIAKQNWHELSPYTTQILKEGNAKLGFKLAKGEVKFEEVRITLFRTFWYSVCRNTFHDEMRRIRKHLERWKTISDPEVMGTIPAPFPNLDIEEYVELFPVVLKMLLRDLIPRKQFEFRIIVFYCVPMLADHIRIPYKHCSQPLFDTIMGRHEWPDPAWKNIELLPWLKSYLIELEGKHNDVDKTTLQRQIEKIACSIMETLAKRKLPCVKKLYQHFEDLIHHYYHSLR